MNRKVTGVLLSVLAIVGILSGCGKKDAAESDKNEVKIGYFPNLTHIATIIGLENNYFAEEFGEDVKISTKTVSNGGLFMEAMATNSIDIGTVGPGPVINYFVKDPKYHIVSGAVNGGAVLVSAGHSGINELADLDGKQVAIPVIGSTQDVMLRKALKDVNLKAKANGGTVDFFAAAPADTATLFIQKSVDAAATQEPWGYILQNQADGKLLLDWEDFAWGKESTNTVVATSDQFLQHDELVKAYLTAHARAVQFVRDEPEEAQALVVKHIKGLTGKELGKEELEAAFSRIEVTTEVNEDVLQEMADISLEADYIKTNEIDGLIDLQVIKAITSK
ncbi:MULTISPECIES: aliphatic sulfonate ABC transporter substrate-binding protein [unclassified Sporosarcina]|uniref:aliphatic sulfonate ABC transporter substrate-binding protein n=1 Tax=unclassified Sporosarcina TaxID=2647733 RepID=UPI0020410E1E|nr:MULTISPECIES: aliphatic sulfonate ABC transporter substrate-binding protein [unclassified Sporosarcina]GKV64746.1 ABC transporter substrate-binding protein [Sporosarcina sp. NCCP-2331]GLB54856.1 ABC transporter substrate-binding protein [Sporosarcina sp. NCCP-2378]